MALFCYSGCNLYSIFLYFALLFASTVFVMNNIIIHKVSSLKFGIHAKFLYQLFGGRAGLPSGYATDEGG